MTIALTFSVVGNIVLVSTLFCCWIHWPIQSRGSFKEFLDIPAEELADIYTKDQLSNAYAGASNSSDLRYHISQAMSIKAVREAFEPED